MLMRGKRALNNVAPLIGKAEECGMDCSQYREAHGYLNDQMDAFIRTFFPDQITPGPGDGVPENRE
jgi:hypothetical protein